MAREIHVVLKDDLDGSDADRTVEFAFDGVQYAIDLSEANIAKFSKVLEPYVAKAERVRKTARTRRSASSSRSNTAEIRQWARDNGFDLSDRGRIPSNVMQAYEAAH